MRDQFSLKNISNFCFVFLLFLAPPSYISNYFSIKPHILFISTVLIFSVLAFHYRINIPTGHNLRTAILLFLLFAFFIVLSGFFNTAITTVSQGVQIIFFLFIAILLINTCDINSVIMLCNRLYAFTVVIYIIFIPLYYLNVLDFTHTYLVSDRSVSSFLGIINSVHLFYAGDDIVFRAQPIFDEPGQASFFGAFLVYLSHKFNLRNYYSRRIIIYGLLLTGSFAHFIVVGLYFIFVEKFLRYNLFIKFFSLFSMIYIIYILYSNNHSFAYFLDRILFSRISDTFTESFSFDNFFSNDNFIYHRFNYSYRATDVLFSSPYWGQGNENFNAVAMNILDVFSRWGIFSFITIVFFLGFFLYTSSGYSDLIFRFILLLLCIQRPSFTQFYFILFFLLTFSSHYRSFINEKHHF